jgi:L,D-peptidoglycan transpeptidase YkuD (ErfK/YbiS/YcfS/YnhG family)
LININTTDIYIRANSNSNNTGLLKFAHKIIACIIGRGGKKSGKFEGDGATPTGRFEILYGFYRADKLRPLSTKIPMHQIKQNYAWCDDPNRPAHFF